MGAIFAAQGQNLEAKPNLRQKRNPPYISPTDDLPTGVKDWEPSAALFGGEDGFTYLDFLTRHGRDWLRPRGWLILECGSNQADRLRKLAVARGYSEVRAEFDLS